MSVTFYTADEVERLKRKIADLRTDLEVANQMKPVWAQGISNDSIAAQINGAALAQLWQILGVEDQTAAVRKLKNMGFSL